MTLVHFVVCKVILGRLDFRVRVFFCLFVLGVEGVSHEENKKIPCCNSYFNLVGL